MATQTGVQLALHAPDRRLTFGFRSSFLLRHSWQEKGTPKSSYIHMQRPDNHKVKPASRALHQVTNDERVGCIWTLHVQPLGKNVWHLSHDYAALNGEPTALDGEPNSASIDLLRLRPKLPSSD